MCTSVTAGAVIRSLISTLLAGVVTEMALPSHCITSCLAANVTAPIIKEPAGRVRQVSVHKMITFNAKFTKHKQNKPCFSYLLSNLIVALRALVSIKWLDLMVLNL